MTAAVSSGTSDQGGSHEADAHRLVVGLAVVALAAAGCGGDDEEAAGTTDTETTTETTPADGSTLSASVGPGFEISLTDADGADVETLAAGTYTVEVDDQSDIHNFHLTRRERRRVDRRERDRDRHVGGHPRRGGYSFVCDPHAGSMSGSFEVSG